MVQEVQEIKKFSDNVDFYQLECDGVLLSQENAVMEAGKSNKISMHDTDFNL